MVISENWSQVSTTKCLKIQLHDIWCVSEFLKIKKNPLNPLKPSKPFKTHKDA
jgi:hypothetical protein